MITIHDIIINFFKFDCRADLRSTGCCCPFGEGWGVAKGTPPVQILSGFSTSGSRSDMRTGVLRDQGALCTVAALVDSGHSQRGTYAAHAVHSRSAGVHACMRPDPDPRCIFNSNMTHRRAPATTPARCRSAGSELFQSERRGLPGRADSGEGGGRDSNACIEVCGDCGD